MGVYLLTRTGFVLLNETVSTPPPAATVQKPAATVPPSVPRSNVAAEVKISAEALAKAQSAKDAASAKTYNEEYLADYNKMAEKYAGLKDKGAGFTLYGRVDTAADGSPVIGMRKSTELDVNTFTQSMIFGTRSILSNLEHLDRGLKGLEAIQEKIKKTTNKVDLEKLEADEKNVQSVMNDTTNSIVRSLTTIKNFSTANDVEAEATAAFAEYTLGKLGESLDLNQMYETFDIA